MATHQALTITLPSLNGNIEAGITVGVDASLPEDRKLPIVSIGNKVASHDLVKSYALAWAYDQFNDQNARSLLMNGKAGMLDLGMVRASGVVPDGDWVMRIVTVQLTDEDLRRVSPILNLEEMKKAITIAVATKANFWLMKHHTGQGAVAGYVKKVLDVFYKDRVTDQLVSAAHNLGHYASTLGVLKVAGIRGIRESQPITSIVGANLTLAQDAKLRFSSMPAGTHRCGIAFEAAKRLVRSVYARFCPNVIDFESIPAIRQEIIANPASYHIGATYLTGNPRAEYSDTDMESYLGRLGIFINTLYKNSTIAKSPHMTISRVESYEDYDADFRNTLIRIQQAQAMSRGRVAEEQIGASPLATSDVLELLKGKYMPHRVVPMEQEAAPGRSAPPN